MTTRGTTTAQRTVVVDARDDRRRREGGQADRADAITVVGDVVALREALSWFETKPLFGWRVLVPRTKEQAGALSDRLRGYGAVPEEVPTIAVEPPRTPQQMERAIKGLVTGRYEWVAFTSRQRRQGGPREVRGVRPGRPRVRRHQGRRGRRADRRGDLLAWGIKPDLVPAGEQSAAGLLEDWPPYDAVFDPIDRVFLPRADIATENLVAGLVERGWEVDDVTAYRTVRAAPPAAPIREAIKSGGFDAVVFTSSSTVRNLVGIAGKPHTVHGDRRASARPRAKTAEEHGLRVDVAAPDAVGRATLAEALAEYGARPAWPPVEAGEPVAAPVAEARRGPPQGDLRPRALAAFPAAGRAGCGGRRRCAAWSRRPGWRRGRPGAADVRPGGRWPSRSPIASMPGVVSTRATRCARRPPRRCRPGVGGLMLFGVPGDEGRHRAPARPTPTASSTSRSATWCAEVGDAHRRHDATCAWTSSPTTATAASWTPTGRSTTTRRWCATPRWASPRRGRGATSSARPG